MILKLNKYNAKRDFEKSPEPTGASARSSKLPRFCVQKHDARNLHYDFRLEYQGVLLSWAIPKGPSLNPHDKRLAIKVEDHPLDYQYFEGIIPKGNYGAGTVEIWDSGTFYTPDATTPKEIEKAFTAGLKKGHLRFILEGEKLRGEFNLLKLKQPSEDNAWLLIKKDDADAIDNEMEKPKKNEKKVIKKKAQKIPEFISPMLATLIEAPFDDEDWLFEVKWDGYRALSFIKEKNVEIKSRNNLSFNDKFPSIVKDLKKIGGQVILDGEVVVLDEVGKSNFQLMQNYNTNTEGALCYYVFDILYKDGKDLRELPLIERKEILKKLLNQVTLEFVRYGDHIVKQGKAFFNEASKSKLEGIIGKKIVSTYQNKRSKDWVKIKTSMRQEVVIGGFTAPRGSRKKFGALLVGIYNDKKRLDYVGHVGGGFSESLLDDIFRQLEPIIQKNSPFHAEIKPNAPVTWVKPKLVCEVVFSEWTKDNIMRHPVFQGLRIDKPAKEIIKEVPEELAQLVPHKRSSKKSVLELTHLDKIYWPEEKYTKGDLLEYYKSIAPFILPHLKNRPITLHRYPEGIMGKDFYQKDLPISHPDWLKTCEIQQEGKINHYLIIDDVNSLLYAVNLGSIDIHPFISRYKSLETPDYCIIDLDPHDISFDKVIEAALTIHEILDDIKVKHYCKTSGGKGLHIFIPLNGKYDYDQSRRFAEVIGYLVHQKLPLTTSLERSPAKRPGKIYIDCLQNRISQTVVAPYSVRPRPHANVSTPLEWKEVNERLDVGKFNLKNIPQRLKKMGDLFAPIQSEKTNLKIVLNRLFKKGLIGKE